MGEYVLLESEEIGMIVFDATLLAALAALTTSLSTLVWAVRRKP